MKSKRKFSIGRNYQATYRFATRVDKDGNVLKTSKITIELSGTDIVKKGLKSVIWANAERLEIPKGYACSVKTNEDE